MLIATFENTENSVDLDIEILNLQNINEGQFFLGSTDRTIDGTLISYANGFKNEISLSAQNMGRDKISILRTCQRNQYEMTFTLTDEYTGLTIITYTGIIDEFSPDFDNYTRLFNATLRVLEI